MGRRVIGPCRLPREPWGSLPRVSQLALGEGSLPRVSAPALGNLFIFFSFFVSFFCETFPHYVKLFAQI
jgi:hypothetical protein